MPPRGLRKIRWHVMHEVTSSQRARSASPLARNGRLSLRAVGLPTSFVLSAGRRAIGVIDQNIIVASGAEHAIDRLAELGMLRIECVIGLRFRA